MPKNEKKTKKKKKKKKKKNKQTKKTETNLIWQQIPTLKNIKLF